MPVSTNNQTQVTVSSSTQKKIINNQILKKIAVGLILLLFAGLIGFGVYYYVKIYRNRETFPQVITSVDEKSLQESGYKKIESSEGKGTIFVPQYWSQIDSSLNVYGDVLNGSNAYVKSYPNSVGRIDANTCKTFAEKSFNELKTLPTYLNATLSESGLKTLKNVEGCHFVAVASVGQKIYEIQNFYVFSKDRIYQVFVQYPQELQSEKNSAEITLSSLQFKD